MTVTKREWNSRPTDVANLFNPAFVSMIIRRAVDGYENESQQGLPFELAFVVLPLVLHEETRAKLPTISTSMQTWIQENREVVVGFSKRTAELVPFGREGIMFGVRRKILSINTNGSLSAGESKLFRVGTFQKSSDEINRVYSKSEFIGRWISQQSSSTTVFAMFGVKP